ncbi:MAG: hypothetical protein IPO13_07015 [Rhodocyclaceae bacterium]|nr:hypothetical protein [Rhodocyclaceae bacterium]
MSCKITFEDGQLVVEDPSQLLRGRHHSQMALWGFRHHQNAKSYIAQSGKAPELLQKVISYLAKAEIHLDLSQDVMLAQQELQRLREDLSQALEAGALFKVAQPSRKVSGSFWSSW